MKKMLLIFAYLLYLSTTQLFGQNNPNPNANLDAFIQDEMELERFPAVSTVIVKNGKIVWLESYGYADIENGIPVTDNTIFLLASISKLFTGTAAMQLYENGIIDLDEDINNHLPWPLTIPNHENEPITFRHLMTHTSSIQDNYGAMATYYDYPDPSISLSDCMQSYFSTAGNHYNASANFLNQAAGTTYEYSNMATALNGYLIENITQNPFNEYCNNNIFEPLCMNKTAWFMSELDSNEVARPYQYVGGNYEPYAHYGFADYPDGQLRSNVLDMANFMIAYMNEGNFGDNSILTAASISEMWSEQVAELEEGQGLNWYQEELYHSGGTALLWGHNGGESGASTEMYIDATNNIGICVLTNGEGDALYICDELYDYALSLSSTNGITPTCETAIGIAEQSQNNLNVYPNPAKDMLIFEFTDKKENYKLLISDAQGTKYIEQNIRTNQHQLALDLPAGIYFYQLIGEEEGVDVFGKFIVAR